ncbi:MAG: ROK family glucokinase [Chloroflexi bacterium]|nr:ROK family glucokinase [Chloroflexota bacterium]
MADKWYLGVDLGGTKIGVGLARNDGEVRCPIFLPTEAEGGPDHVIARILWAADRVLDDAGMTRRQVAGIGIGAPGPLDGPNGVVVTAPNMPGWDHVPLRDRISRGLDMPAYLENDANAAALGEARFGAARGSSHVIYVTLGTGIGGGLVMNGELVRGATGAAGEIGHMVIDMNGPRCGCGNYGCWEALASGTAIAREARAIVASGRPTAITMMSEGSPDGVSARTVFLAAIEGDSVALGILSNAALFLGVGLANLVNLFNPQVGVIGGGMTSMGDLLLEPALAHMRKRAFAPSVEAARFVQAALGEHAGILGAAALCMNPQQSRTRA